jgi:hypothetical protein
MADERRSARRESLESVSGLREEKKGGALRSGIDSGIESIPFCGCSRRAFAA